MDYRTGKCSQCGAEYKIPASFAHNAARCKQCRGVVHLGPVQGAAATAAVAIPAKRVVPKAATPQAPRPSTHADAAGTPGQPSARPNAPKAEPVAAPSAPEAPAASAPARSAPPPDSTLRREPLQEAAGSRGARAGEKGPKKQSPAGWIVAGLVLVALALFVFRDALFGREAQSEAGPAIEAPVNPAGGAAEAPAPDAPR